MQMQSSHIRTVCLCFLACKASSFWSIFQENSEKRVFWSSPYCFLSVTPHGWLFIHRHVAVFVSHTLWLVVCSTWYAMTGCFEQKAEQARDLHSSAFIISFVDDLSLLFALRSIPPARLKQVTDLLESDVIVRFVH